MLDLFPEEKRIWKLFISYPIAGDDYDTFMNRLSTATEAFKWEDITDTSDNFATSMDECDILIVLSGLWEKNKDILSKHISYAQTFNKPIVIIRPYGAEEIPEGLQDVATRVVGWNTACIVDAILLSLNLPIL